MFSKSDKAHGAATRARGAAGLSIIGADVVITGDIAADGDLHIDGAVKGDIRCAALTQGGSGRISGNVVTDAARLAGTVDGTVTARTLTIEKSARVTGDLSYETLSIDGGAQVDGRFTHQPEAGEAPLKLITAAE